MGVRYQEVLLLLAACALAAAETANKAAETNKVANKDVKKDAKDGDNFLYQYEDYDSADDQEVLFNEDKPCPRDCTCTVSQGYRIAKCNRLEVGTQKFGDDITDLVIEHSSYPIELDDFVFKKLGLHQVATIKIVNSTISKVGPNAFHGLHELYAVNLSNNKLQRLDPETFASNRKLLLLTLSHNPLNISGLSYFLNASSVQELDVSYCDIHNIDGNTFKNMPGLMYLNVAGNRLSQMNSDTFKKLLDLEELDLSDNLIKFLPDDIFSENTELATLHILKNPIDTVYGLQISDLLTLNAGQTKLQFIGPSMFNGMTYIANLNLSGNSIEKIHNQAFHKLVELNYLDLSYNNMDYISSVLIKENIELDIFKISNNPRIKHLPVNGFECTADQFNIYLFDASNCGLEEIFDNSLQTFTALSVINLSNNKIRTVSSKVFSMCPKLNEINLSNNMLNTLDAKIFEKNKELGKLHLQGNPLTVISAEVFVHTPLMTWLDMSHAQLTTLWKTEKNHTASLLSNLTFLNVSHNRITELKQSELDNFNKLRTLDISYNPLACSRDFENLLTWLSKRKVSPNAVPDSIANLARDAKDEDETYSWEFLTRKTCDGALPHPVERLPEPVSDEEIWERIDKDSIGNFDLKNTLDDGKVADDTLTKKENEYTVDDDKNETDDDGELADDEEEEDEEDDDEDDDDASEDTDDTGDDNVNLKVKLIEKSSTAAPLPVPVAKSPKTATVLNIKLLDSMYDDLEPDYEEVSSEQRHGKYEYLWPITIAILGALLLLLVTAKVVSMMCTRRNQQIRYNSAIIAAMSNANRTKKDCGLVYQQLSEDLTGPATPKLNRYQPLHNVTVNASNMSYESSPFHHTNIVPEHV